MSFRLLHLADLHLGQRFHDQGRAQDEEHALQQVLQIAEEAQVDVVVLAGDIFDVAHPGARDCERYDRFLAQLVGDAGVGSVVVIAGNHDSPTRIAAPRRLYSAARVHVRGQWRLDAGPEDCIVELTGRSGEIVGRSLAIPFLREGDVRIRRAGESLQHAAQEHVKALEQRLAELHAAVPRDLPYVVVAHAFATGGSFGGGERPVQVGNEARVPAAAFAGDAGYLALGHLHRPQLVDGQEHWRYPGSLLPTGFDELARPRQVLVAELPDSGAATVRSHELEPCRRYLRIEGNQVELEQQILALPPWQGEGPRPWVRGFAELTGPAPGLAQRLGDLAQKRGWQLLGVESRTPRAAARQDSEEHAPPGEVDIENSSAVFDKLLEHRGIQGEDAEDLRRSFTWLQEHAVELLEGDPLEGGD
ncbi:MAG: hypothetical protein CSA62_06055 [Planctomycetota bacterium]|nr:MAG: hypothetical protein CSA62_06055 [Planctomycetota bacterium]